MKLTEYLLFGVIGWSALGLLGTVASFRRGQHAKVRRHLAWLMTVLGAYVVVLLLVSAMQPQKIVTMGQDQCYGRMCFAVTSFDELPGLVAGDPSRVLRVAIRVSNRAEAADEDSGLRAFLMDAQGRTWQPLPGLTGNRLTATLAGKSEMVSRPMFQVTQDSTDLKLVFTHGKWQLRRLIIGDSDSLGHRPTVVELRR